MNDSKRNKSLHSTPLCKNNLIQFFSCRFEKEYTLTISVRDRAGERNASFTKCVGDVIDANGELQFDIYKPLVMNLHNSLASSKKKE